MPAGSKSLFNYPGVTLEKLYRLTTMVPILAALAFGIRPPGIRNKRMRRRSGDSAEAANR